MRIAQISPTALGSVSDRELLSLHRRLHQLAAHLFPELPLAKVEPRLLARAHSYILREFHRRGFQHTPHDMLDWVTASTPVRNPSGLEEAAGMYLVAPHGFWLATGYKTAVVKAQPLSWLNQRLAIVQDGLALGFVTFQEPEEIDLATFRRLRELHRISEEERRRWWPDREKLYLYRVRSVVRFPNPVPVRVPRGVQNYIRRLVLKARHVAALAIVTSPQGILLIRRRNPPRVWSPPGGFLGQRTPDEAARQELEEECGLTPDALVGELPVMTIGDTLIYPLVYRIQKPGQVRLKESEARDWGWFRPEELPEDVSPSPAILRAAFMAATKAETPIYHTDELSAMHAALPDEVVLIPDWLSISGGALYARPPRQAHDVDLIARGLSFIPDGTRLKLSRLFQALTGKPIHWSSELEGPTWAYAPLYDLVARKKESTAVVEPGEPETAGALYKAKVVEDARAIEVGKPIAHYHVAGEYYTGDEEELWDKFARRAAEKGVPLAVQEKFDGFRLHIHRQGEKLWVFSEQGLERQGVFPGLAAALPDGTYILDTEFVELDSEGRPKPRWVMAWMGSAKEPLDPMPHIEVNVHDIMWLGERNVTQEPYTERLKLLEELLAKTPKSERYVVKAAPTHFARNKEEFMKAIAWAKAEQGSEGAMVKFANFTYQPGMVGSIAKYKAAVEVDVAVIGWRKVPRGKPAGTHWTRAEAMRQLPRALRESNTYIFRVAIRGPGGLIPLEAEQKVAPGALKLDWDEERQRWKGLDDPRLWHMCPGFAQRKEGEYAYANTYAVRVSPEELRCGLILTVAPMEMRLIKKDDGTLGLTWMFPRVKNTKPKGSQPGELEAVLRAFNLKLPAGGESKFPVVKASPVQNPDYYPPEKPRPFVLQLHFRGRSVHGDFRVMLEKILEGWTISLQQPGYIKEPVMNLAQARRYFQDPKAWKFDFAKGEILPRQVQTTIQGRPRTIVRPGNLRAMPKKAEIPSDWLRVEGVTERPDPGERIPVGATKNYPGVFLIADQGRAEIGARKPWFFEYFLHGKYLKGRYVFRLVGRREATEKGVLPPGQQEERAREPYYWVMMKPDTELPYVLSQDAIEAKWLPPKGISALPLAMRRKVPKELRYWEVEGDEALERRRRLAETASGLAKMPAMFTSMGGKRILAPKLAQMVPPHDTYVEPFAGSAALFFYKGRSRREVLNDINPDIISIYRFFRDGKDEDFAWLARQDWEGREPLYERLKAARPLSERAKVRRLLYLYRYGFHPATRFHDANDFRHSLTGYVFKRFTDPARMARYRARLRGVILHAEDASRIIRRYDSPQTFFYLDPPYLGREDMFGNRGEITGQFDEDKWRDLLRLLKKIKGKFLLSMGDQTYHQLKDELQGWQVRRVRTMRMYRGHGNFPEKYKLHRRPIEYEYVVANYPLPAVLKAAPGFVLQRHWFRGQIVVRWGPSSQHYDLRLRRPDGSFLHMVMDGDPRYRTVLGYLKPMGREAKVTDVEGQVHDVMAIRERVQLKPGTPANPTKETPAFLETLDYGSAEILEEGPEFIKVALRGRQGTYVLAMRREKPDEPMWAISLSEGPQVKKWTVPILKVDEEKRLVYGVVLKPNVPDSQNDVATPEEIERAAHEFLRRSRLIDYQHERVLDENEAVPVESYIAPQDLHWDGYTVPKGAWVMVTHIPSDTIWKEVKEGRLRSYSIRGFGRRIPARRVEHANTG